jgi:hypothetical protein
MLTTTERKSLELIQQIQTAQAKLLRLHGHTKESRFFTEISVTEQLAALADKDGTEDLEPADVGWLIDDTIKGLIEWIHNH